MGFKVEGLDRAMKQTKDMMANFKEAATGKWLEQVAQTANSICPDAKVTFVRGQKSGQMGEIVIPTKESAECVIKAIDRIVTTAPEPTRTMLRQYKGQVQKRLSNA